MLEVSLLQKVNELWNKIYGPPLFSNTMSRNRYKTIMTHLRFDDVLSRRREKSADKFGMFREVWERFIDNSQACYTPGSDLTIVPLQIKMFIYTVYGIKTR